MIQVVVLTRLNEENDIRLDGSRYDELLHEDNICTGRNNIHG